MCRAAGTFSLRAGGFDKLKTAADHETLLKGNFVGLPTEWIPEIAAQVAAATPSSAGETQPVATTAHTHQSDSFHRCCRRYCRRCYCRCYCRRYTRRCCRRYCRRYHRRYCRRCRCRQCTRHCLKRSGGEALSLGCGPAIELRVCPWQSSNLASKGMCVPGCGLRTHIPYNFQLMCVTLYGEQRNTLPFSSLFLRATALSRRTVTTSSATCVPPLDRNQASASSAVRSTARASSCWATQPTG